MNTKTVRSTLTAAFGSLSQRQKNRLAYHEERGTRIACGKNAVKYDIRNGG